MKVLWLTNIPSPYRVDFFNELGTQCELTVLFERFNSSERNQKWQTDDFVNFNGIILNGINMDTDKAFCFSVGKWLKKDAFDIIVISNVATPTGILAIEIMNFKGIPFVIEGDGGFAKAGKGLKENFKRHLIKSAQKWFSTGGTHTEYYLTYGAKKEEIYVYPFTSIHSRDIENKVLNCEDKKQLKQKLDIVEEKAIISVGQFIHRKGFDLLLQAALRIPKNCGIYIIGGDATPEYIDFKTKYKLQNVHFIGFKNKDELKEYYKACDLFVLPTREDIWGLVINEAMAHGLPIITTDRCIAGLEIVDDENGRIVSVDSVDEIVNGINTILSDPEMMSNMSKSSLEKIRYYTIENMAKVHSDLFKTWMK